MEINDTKVKKIFNNLNLKVKEIIKINTYSNFLIKVKTDSGNYFLKVFTNQKENKIGHKLSYLYPLLSKKNIPVPDVLKYDNSLQVLSHPYLIITEVKGKMLGESIDRFKGQDLKEFYYEFGKVVAKIHSITFQEFGETYDGKIVKGFSEIGDKGPYKNWKEMHSEIINSRLDIFRGSSFEDLINPIKEWFENASNLIDYDITPRLLHIDLNQKNIFIKDNKISGIIDFDDAFIGHNEEELMRTESANFSNNDVLRHAFFKGYTEVISLDEGYEKRRTFYYLSRLLVHIDCIIKYGEDYISDIEKEKKSIKEEIMKILKGKSINFDKNG